MDNLKFGPSLSNHVVLSAPVDNRFDRLVPAKLNLHDQLNTIQRRPNHQTAKVSMEPNSQQFPAAADDPAQASVNQQPVVVGNQRPSTSAQLLVNPRFTSAFSFHNSFRILHFIELHLSVSTPANNPCHCSRSQRRSTDPFTSAIVF